MTLSNRYVRTEGWLAEEKAGKVLYRGVFGSQKPGGRLANAFDLRLKNIANTNVVTLGDQLLALWEAAEPHALDPAASRPADCPASMVCSKKGKPSVPTPASIPATTVAQRWSPSG